MRRLTLIVAASIGMLLAIPAIGASPDVYNNLTPNNSMAIATRPDTAAFEIEAADDFFLGTQTNVTGASFTGLFVPGSAGTPSVSQVVVEIYRVFPADSNVGRTSGPPTFSTSQVPTRVNSPSDVAFNSKDSGAAELTFSTSVLAATFTALNSVQPAGIHPIPGQTTLGNGPLTGQEVQVNVSFASAFNLPADHYFFVPQVTLTNGGQFYWLSASRPISGAGTTPFPLGVTDLQAWTRDANLDPDWLRVGTDIVGGATPPTFNAAFSLSGVAAVPEPETYAMMLAGLGLLGFVARRRKQKAG
jgi:hypothetical protein